MKKFKLFIILVIFSACNPGQRLAHLIKRHPELVKTDTIKVRDTIIVPGVKKDSTFYYRTSDTVTLKQNRLEMKYYFNTKDSTVYISGKCKTDTLYKDRVLYINKTEVEKALTIGQRIKIWLFDNWWWILAIISVVVFIFRKVIKTYLGL